MRDINSKTNTNTSLSQTVSSTDSVPVIDIVVVTYNNATTLEYLARSLRAQKGVEWKLYCVDNSPDDDTFDTFTRLFPHSWIYHDKNNSGFGAGINRAVRAGSHDWLFIINPDAYLAGPHDLFTLWKKTVAVQQFYQNENIIVGPRLSYPDGQSYPTGRAFPSIVGGSLHAIGSLFHKGWKGYLTPQGRKINNDCTEVDWVSGAAMILPRTTFSALGGFDEKYRMYAEDMDLCWRLRRMQGQVVRLDTLALIHIGGVSSGGGNAQTKRWHHESMIKYLNTTTTGWERLTLLLIIPGLFLRLWCVLLVDKYAQRGAIKRDSAV